MISSFGKPLPVQRTDRQWGEFTGAIYRDFTLSYPATVLSGPVSHRSEAWPIVRYTIKGKGLKKRLVTGESALHDFACDLLPADQAVLGNPSLVGELRSSGTTIALASIGPSESMVELARIESATSQWTLSLKVLRRSPVVGEGDVSVVDSQFGELAKLQRRDFSWTEQTQSGLGFGRSKRGVFLDIAAQSLTSEDKKLAMVFLLACYFQLLELPFNTDVTSS